MNEETLRARFPNASEQFIRANLTGVCSFKPYLEASDSVVERAAWNGPLAEAKAKAGNPGRFLVRVTSYRRRLLDEDNLSEKYVVDCARYAGLLPADSPDQTKIEVCQVKVSRKEDEKTLIEITPP